MVEILAIDLHEADVGVCAKCGTVLYIRSAWKDYLTLSLLKVGDVLVMDICAECLDTDNFLQNLPREAFFNTYTQGEE